MGDCVPSQGSFHFRSEADTGPCHLSVEELLLDYEGILILLTGLQPNEAIVLKCNCGKKGTRDEGHRQHPRYIRRCCKKLIALARAAGVESKNIQTSVLSMGPEYTEEKIPKFLGYEVSQTITITLTDLSKYEDLMTSFLKVGVNRVDGIDFLVADSKKYTEDAQLKAVRAAREKATKMAAELGQSLGKPWELTEEVDPEYTHFLTLGNVKPYSYVGAPDTSTIAGGEVSIRSKVRVSFQLE